MKNFNWKMFFISLITVIFTALMGYLLSMNSKNVYNNINLPFFAPPSILFAIIWPILYVLMGISLYLILISKSKIKNSAIEIFFIQIGVNLLWPIAFFKLELFLLALMLLIVLDILVIIMIKIFHGINKPAAYIQIPYIVWIIFATILNLSIVILN